VTEVVEEQFEKFDKKNLTHGDDDRNFSEQQRDSLTPIRSDRLQKKSRAQINLIRRTNEPNKTAAPANTTKSKPSSFSRQTLSSRERRTVATIRKSLLLLQLKIGKEQIKNQSIVVLVNELKKRRVGNTK